MSSASRLTKIFSVISLNIFRFILYFLQCQHVARQNCCSYCAQSWTDLSSYHLYQDTGRIIQRCSRAAVPILLQLISRHFRATYMQAFCVTLLSEVVLRYYSAPFGHRAVRARGQIAMSQFFFRSITVLQA